MTIPILLLLAAVLVGVTVNLLWQLWKKRLAPPTPSARVGRSAEADCNVAVHEAGHGVTAWACTTVKTIDRIDIDGDGDDVAGTHERLSLALESHEATWCDVVIKLGGVAAEVMVYGKIRTWTARTDLVEARALAKQILQRNAAAPSWATPKGQAATLPLDLMYDPPLSEEEHRVLDHAYRMARTVVSAYRDGHGRLVGVLLYKRHMTNAEVLAVLGPRTFYVRNVVSSIIRGKGEPAAWFHLPTPEKAAAG